MNIPPLLLIVLQGSQQILFHGLFEIVLQKYVDTECVRTFDFADESAAGFDYLVGYSCRVYALDTICYTSRLIELKCLPVTFGKVAQGGVVEHHVRRMVRYSVKNVPAGGRMQVHDGRRYFNICLVYGMTCPHHHVVFQFVAEIDRVLALRTFEVSISLATVLCLKPSVASSTASFVI